MKKRFLMFALVLVLAIGAFALVGCGGDDDAATVSTDGDDTAATASVLRVGTDPTYAPMEFFDENNEITGFDIDLMRAIAAEMGREVEFVNTGWDEVLLINTATDLDMVISSITIRPDRAESILFSDPYFVSVQGLAVPVGSDITSPDDFVEGTKIGVQNGTTGDFTVSELWSTDEEFDGDPDNIGVEVKRYAGGNEAMLAMASGEVEAVVLDSPVVEMYTQQDELNATFLGDIADAEIEKFGMGFPLASTELAAEVNAALAKVIASGKYAEIYAKWFEGATPVMP